MLGVVRAHTPVARSLRLGAGIRAGRGADFESGKPRSLILAYAKEPITPQVQMEVLPALIQHHPRYKDTICCDFCGDDHPVYVYRATRLSNGKPVRAGGVALRWAACKICSAAVDKDDWGVVVGRMRLRLNVLMKQTLGRPAPPASQLQFATDQYIAEFKRDAIPLAQDAPVWLPVGTGRTSQ
jgi:hypothetical protein